MRAFAGALGFGFLLLACGSSSGGAPGSDDASIPKDGSMTLKDHSSPAADSALGADVRDASGADVSAPGDAGDTGTASEAGTLQTMEATFYGWDDNCPPGGAIAYPMSAGFPTIHDTAGGIGTYANPITFATDKDEIPIGTIVYAPFIEKYLVMEDDCGQCDTDWSTSMTWHIDIWMNSNGTESPTALDSCEDQWTQSATTIEIDPPPGRTVTTAPLFVPSTNTCRSSP
jgi:3D (Asp-Asp-Asp) domain-containing protein